MVPPGASYTANELTANQPGVELADFDQIGLRPGFFLSYVYVKGAYVSTALFGQHAITGKVDAITAANNSMMNVIPKSLGG